MTARPIAALLAAQDAPTVRPPPSDVFIVIGRKSDHQVTIERHTLGEALGTTDRLLALKYGVYVRRASNRVAK
jgi:hypothetical protein